MMATWTGSAMAMRIGLGDKPCQQAIEGVVGLGLARRGPGRAHRLCPRAAMAAHREAGVALLGDVEGRPREPGRDDVDDGALPAAARALALAVLEPVDVERQPPDEVEPVGVLVD